MFDNRPRFDVAVIILTATTGVLNIMHLARGAGDRTFHDRLVARPDTGSVVLTAVSRNAQI